ncbi:MAG: tRNA (N(6)-L-threonylcarbamoyladenosine(37)-C(2))-methylthiotransferase MtaB [Clostridia bacterium]|nr:tRNA (N(6)-L-threonylcarbamoyladenosine(37)-C(2))-methylthiotransferase MtaB [Clostridia bacterium]
MKAAIYTLGCKVNQYESAALAGVLKKAGVEIVDFSDTADVYVINTCSVTAESDRKSRSAINRAVKKNPAALICVCGCYAQLQSERVMAMPGVDIVTGTKDRMAFAKLIIENAGRKSKLLSVRDPFSVREFEKMSASDALERTRMSIKIEDGCDNFCSYCVIPYARGPIVSKPFSDIQSELSGIIKRGYKEIVLTGIHISSYGKDIKYEKTLSDVLSLCEDAEGDFRVRLGSLNLSCFDEAFLSALPSFKRLCPHFHISLQSGCDRTLAAMNRRYTAAEFEETLIKIRRALPSSSVTTDVIVGFPGETEEDFSESLEFVKRQRFLKVHVFPFSSRPGTRAEKMPGHLTRAEKSRRVAVMSEAAKGVAERFLDEQTGKVREVLIEEKTDDCTYRGYTENYCMTHVFSETPIEGERVAVRIEKREGEVLFGGAARPFVR